MNSQMMRLAFGVKCSAGKSPKAACRAAAGHRGLALSSDGSSSDASAAVPSPAAARPKK